MIKGKDVLVAWKWLNATTAQRLKIMQKPWFRSLLQEPKDSYLINELPIGTEAEQKMYLHLSSMRNYFNYIESKDATLVLFLGLIHYSKLQILSNRLLFIKEEKIYFINEA